jgi:hypothetical protein
VSGLSDEELAQTGTWIASVQLPDGMIPWYPGGHADPWNHVEAAMALAATGRIAEAELAYDWLRSTQLPDGSWCLYYLQDGVEEPRRDPNVCAYMATGLWWHHLLTGDVDVLERLWPTMERGVDWALALQTVGGEVLWSVDPDGRRGRFALLTSSSSIYHSVLCAARIADRLGRPRPDWVAAARRIADAIGGPSDGFLGKDRWAMDWYYPVLCGALPVDQGRVRLAAGWDRFVMEGVGVRCVDDQPWVTAAETSECAMAHDAVGEHDRARLLLDWTAHLRAGDGAYWTGCVHPECVRYPGGERSTYTAAAVVLAHHVLAGGSAAAGLFRDGLELTVPERGGVRGG